MPLYGNMNTMDDLMEGENWLDMMVGFLTETYDELRPLFDGVLQTLHEPVKIATLDHAAIAASQRDLICAAQLPEHSRLELLFRRLYALQNARARGGTRRLRGVSERARFWALGGGRLSHRRGRRRL